MARRFPNPKPDRSSAPAADAGAPGEGLIARSRWVGLLLALLTAGMLVLCFAPFNVWPLAYVCHVPWLLMVGLSTSARRVYVLSYLMGAAFFCTSIYWLFMVTGLGSAVLFAIFAVHFPLMACPIRHVIRRRRWPLVFTFPFIWVGSEAVRSMFLLEFPWNLLGHSHHALRPMIQISDLVGAYGVSFVLAATNGALADLLLMRWLPAADGATQPPRRRVLSPVAAAVLIVATLAYGAYRLREGRTTMSPGPTVAVIQGNYPNYVDPRAHGQVATPRQRADRYFELLDASAAEKPDLFLLPETPWYMSLNAEHLAVASRQDYYGMYSSVTCYEAFRRRAMEYAAYIVTGSASVEPTPLDLRAKERRFNSAFVFSPDGSPPARYDKIHLVMIGEYVPFRFGPLRFLYLWINRIVPFYSEDYEYSLSPGEIFRTFRMTDRAGKSYGFATPICYENVMPYISRRFVIDEHGEKRCDFLLNLSNDGWFLHSAELPQHLAASVFRAVENRVGMARAVNTGISCFIEPDGRVHDPVAVGGKVVGPEVDGYRVARVTVDSRRTLYARAGDWFALLCIGLWIVFYLDYMLIRSVGQLQRKEDAA
ncbi:MAG: apolipoprotein N-acyltransferase [Oceanicaulis sp.]|jgi:apolipoprotein N-acyltransferase|nr:apolipoprotein N-acyltransferase [Oceanicaulis sp.]